MSGENKRWSIPGEILFGHKEERSLTPATTWMSSGRKPDATVQLSSGPLYGTPTQAHTGTEGRGAAAAAGGTRSGRLRAVGTGLRSE